MFSGNKSTPLPHDVRIIRTTREARTVPGTGAREEKRPSCREKPPQSTVVESEIQELFSIPQPSCRRVNLAGVDEMDIRWFGDAFNFDPSVEGRGETEGGLVGNNAQVA